MPTTARLPYRKTTDSFQPGAKTLPGRYFVSPAIFDDEQQNIFSEHWLLVGHRNQIEEGSYFLADVAGESVIITRAASGDAEGLGSAGANLRGFYNVCRHRGTRLCQAGAGQVRAIQCPYHAWTYGLDGKLLGAPHMEGVPGFVRSDYSLQPVNLGLWEGFIFVHLGRSPTPIEHWFAPLAAKFSHWNLATLRSVRRIEYVVQANWKLIFENYSECYHCPGVHPALSKLTPYDSAENDLCEGPFLGGFMSLKQGRSLTRTGDACAAPVGDMIGQDNGKVFYYAIFPNMLLSMHPDYVMVHQVWPQAPDRTLIYCDWFFHPNAEMAREAGHNYNPADAIDFWDMTNREDWHVCELSQQGIGSRAYQPGPYSARESIPAAWDREYLRQLSDAASLY